MAAPAGDSASRRGAPPTKQKERKASLRSMHPPITSQRRRRGGSMEGDVDAERIAPRMSRSPPTAARRRAPLAVPRTGPHDARQSPAAARGPDPHRRHTVACPSDLRKRSTRSCRRDVIAAESFLHLGRRSPVACARSPLGREREAPWVARHRHAKVRALPAARRWCGPSTHSRPVRTDVAAPAAHVATAPPANAPR